MSATYITKSTAQRIAARLRRDGFACSLDDVFHVYTYGTHANDALASRVLQEFDAEGVQV